MISGIELFRSSLDLEKKLIVNSKSMQPTNFIVHWMFYMYIKHYLKLALIFYLNTLISLLNKRESHNKYLIFSIDILHQHLSQQSRWSYPLMLSWLQSTQNFEMWPKLFSAKIQSISIQIFNNVVSNIMHYCKKVPIYNRKFSLSNLPIQKNFNPIILCLKGYLSWSLAHKKNSRIQPFWMRWRRELKKVLNSS